MSVDSEHRNGSRAPLATAIRFWKWNEPRTAQGGELSTSGIFLRTHDVIQEGAHVTIRLELPGHSGITVLGRVVRTVKGGLLEVAGMGIRFLDLVPTQKALIEEFVAARTVQEFA